jgi:hypothetical protein
VTVTSFDADDKCRKHYRLEYTVAPIIRDRHGIPKTSSQFKFPGFRAVIWIEGFSPVRIVESAAITSIIEAAPYAAG